MNKTKYTEGSETKLTVDIIGLQKMLGVGKATARKVGEDAGASIKVGRRKIYHVEKIKKYLESLTE